MKRILFMLFAVIMSTVACHAAMSNSKVRKETRFLTDKMAYELNLNTAQYNDVYEINYDFIFKFIDKSGYDGWVGCEYKPLTTTEAGLSWINQYR